jgi:membrane-bound lytic murein transglycosylase A
MARQTGAEPTVVPAAPFPAVLTPRAFSEIPGFADDDHGAAFRALRSGGVVLGEAPPKPRAAALDASALAGILAAAAHLPEDLPAFAARRFFEDNFVPHEVRGGGGGFFTGYYEPVVDGSLSRSDRFSVPLYRVPDDLVEFDPDDPPPGLDPAQRFARRTPAGLTPYPDRAAIEAGWLAGRNLELVWLADAVEAFFIHIQGAARIRLVEGGSLRVTYAGKSGHPYTPIGRVLVEMGAIEKGTATMQAIRAWLAAHPLDAPDVMAANRSFIFFREAPVADATQGPIAAAKVPLVAGRSLAVDRLLYSFHLPVFVETTLPSGAALRRLMVAHDTGSAIVGPARGDIFFGSGEAAGAIAGAMRAPGRFIVLAPKAVR